MANHASAEKRNRQRQGRRARNQAAQSMVRTSVKRARTALATGKADSAKQHVADAAQALARAAGKGIVHHKAASRTTSRLQSALHKIQG